MTLQEFQEFIELQHAYYRKVKRQTKKDRIYARTIKLGEEYGELCDEVLEYMHDQRASKSRRHHVGDLEGEFADVMVVLFMLAKAMDVDIMRALDAKIRRIKSRHNKQL